MDTSDQYADAPDAMIQTRLSKSSLSSLIVSIVSIICCPVGSLVGFLGLLLGIIGLIRTSTPGVEGRGLAITGIVLSLIGMVIGTGLVIGIAGAMGAVIEPAERSIIALDGGDAGGLRTTLSPQLEQQVTDEQIAAFAQALRDDYGSLVKAPSSLWEYITLAVRGGPAMQGTRAQQLMPVAAEFDSGMVVFQFQASPDGPPFVWDDIGFVRADGTTLWLSEIEP